MPPKNTMLGPGTVYFHTPEGLQPLHTLGGTPDIEAEAPEWPKDNPYVIKADQEATFTAEAKINPDVVKAFTAVGVTCAQAVEALAKFCRAVVDCVGAILGGMDIGQLLKAAKVQAALKEAPPRVRHLANHGKKYRTQKKNINRALRDHERRQRG